MKTFLTTLLFASSASAITPVDSAAMLKSGQWEVGVFSPLRLGLSDKLELRLHPLTALVSPHFTLRFEHGELHGGTLVGEWGLGVPTYGMRLLQGDAAGTLFPNDHEIPWMVTPRAGMVWSKGNDKRMYTLRADLTLGVAFTQPERSVSRTGAGWLDLLFAPASDGYRARLGGIYDRSLSERLRGRTSVDIYATGNPDNPLMVLGRQVFDFGMFKGKDGRWNRIGFGAAWLNSQSHALGGGRSNDFMPVIDLVF